MGSFNLDGNNSSDEEEESNPTTSPNRSESELSKDLEKLSEEEKAMVQATGSLVWNFFTKKDSNEAICKSCGAVRKTPTGTTKTLVNHLSQSHVKSYQQFVKLDDIKKKLIASTKKKTETDNQKEKVSQPTLLDMKGRFGVLPAKSAKAADISKAIAIFLLKGLHAYDTVSEEGFKHLIWRLEPRYVIPHRTTFSRSIVPKLYEEVRAAQNAYLKRVVNHLQSLTITTDMWTSRAKDPFISCTTQFIDNIKEEFSLKHLVIDCKPFPHPHSAERICNAVYEMLDGIGVDTQKVKVYVVTDNDPKIIAALPQPSAAKSADISLPDVLRNRKPWTHLACFDHTLQLSITDARSDIGANTVIEKVSGIVSRYNYSTSARQNLHKYQKETKTVKHELIKNVSTR